jgi:hypothetical protein
VFLKPVEALEVANGDNFYGRGSTTDGHRSKSEKRKSGKAETGALGKSHAQSQMNTDKKEAVGRTCRSAFLGFGRSNGSPRIGAEKKG